MINFEKCNNDSSLNTVFNRKAESVHDSADQKSGNEYDLRNDKLEEVSVHLPFERIENCRDLGGIRTIDGRVILPGKLLRSANLHHASAQDVLTLDNMGIDHIIDLRTDWEIDAQPDRLSEKMKLTHLPVIHESTAARREGGQLHLAEDVIRSTRDTLETIYPLLVLSPQAKKVWKAFFAMLLDEPGKYLWHCTQGKDRTGIGAILLLNALNVDEKIIENEYLQTNLYMDHGLKGEGKIIREGLKEFIGIQDDLSAAMQASPAYYQAMKKAVEAEYGSIQNYLLNALELSPADFEKLKRLYTAED